MTSCNSTALEFLIPSYKRPHTVIKAIESIALQVRDLQLSDVVKITIVDDSSPNINFSEIVDFIYPFSKFISFTQNSVNKGMSLNIRDMVSNSEADFCTILTDDDLLQPNSLSQIFKFLNTLSHNSNNILVGSFFVPRYSYLEDKSLHCIVCNPFNKDMIIKSSPLNSVKYLHNGFILTGLFFKPKLINFQLWNDNIENSFFPIIYFADLLLRYDCIFVNQNWFVHTVMNKCHWESWGENEKAILARLYVDYINAVTLSTQRGLLRVSREISTLWILREEFFLYLKQMNSTLSIINVANVDKSISLRLTYRLAITIFKINNKIFKPIKTYIKFCIKGDFKNQAQKINN